MQLLRKYFRRSECNLRRQNLQNITGQMTVINSNALDTQTEGNKVQTIRNIHCNLFHEIEK